MAQIMFWATCEEDADAECSWIRMVAQACEYFLRSLFFNALAFVECVEHDENISRAS